MSLYIGEFVGTTMLLFLISGMVANMVLEQSAMKNSGNFLIIFGCGTIVMLCSLMFSGVSGAHFNPAFTIAAAVNGSFEWRLVPGYIIAQMLGGICGPCISYTVYKDHFDKTTDKSAILSVFSTSPSIKNKPRNLWTEIVASFVLIFSSLRIGDIPDLAPGLDKIFICAILIVIGVALGGITGYAINPARDLGPRIAHAILPIKNKGSSNWDYAWIPVVGPILGGLLAVGIYRLIPW